MSEIFDPRSVWFVGAGPGDRELITQRLPVAAAGAGCYLRRIAD